MADRGVASDASVDIVLGLRWYQRLKGWLWGYDFFISYHWASGGTYAVNLAAQLREKGYDVFLDRAEYAMGDDWKRIGEVALCNTQRLVLIATREAVFKSKPVEREVVLFTDRGKHCIPVFFGDTFVDYENEDKAVVLEHLPDSTLYISDVPESLEVGPAKEVVHQLAAAHSIMRRRKLRQAIILIAVAALATLALVATVSWINAEIARDSELEAHGQSEKLVGDMSLRNARRAEIIENDASAGALWYAQVLQTKGQQASSSRSAVRRLIGPMIARIPRHSFNNDAPVVSLSLSANGNILAAGLAGGRVHLWNMVTNNIGSTLSHAEGTIQAMAFSADGKWLATASYDTARIWNVRTGLQHGKTIKHSYQIYVLAFSPDNKTLATASADDTARLWDVDTSQPRGIPLKHNDAVVAVSFTPDGKLLATGSWDGTARLWDTELGEPFGKPFKHDGTVLDVSFSPDGETLATSTGSRAGPHGAAQLWNVLTGQPLHERLQHKDEVLEVSFSPDGGTLATASSDGTAQLWNVTTGQPRGEPLKHYGDVLSLTFSLDGKYLATASGIVDGGERPLKRSDEPNEVRLWDAMTGEPFCAPLKHYHKITGLSFCPDGKTLLTGSFDGFLREWNLVEAQYDGGRLGKSFVSASFSYDLKRLATHTHDRTVQVWDVETGKAWGDPIKHDGQILVQSFDRSGKILAIAGRGGTAQLWNTETNQPFGSPLKHESDVWELSFSPDGKTLATGTEEGRVSLWDTVSGKRKHGSRRHQDKITALSFSPDGKTLATGASPVAASSKVIFLDTATSKTVGKPQEESHGLDAISFSPGGGVVASVTDYAVLLWDGATLLPRGKAISHDKVVEAAVFSPNGKQIAIATNDGVVQFWDTSTLKPLGDPIEHGTTAKKLSYSPNGLTLAVATGAYGEPYEVRLWDVITGSPQGSVLRHEGAIRALSFRPDGKQIATASTDGFARLWNLMDPIEADSERIQLSVELRTGQTIENGSVRNLTMAELAGRRRLLNDMGGDCLE